MVTQLPGEAFVQVASGIAVPPRAPYTPQTSTSSQPAPTPASNDYRTYAVDFAKTERAILSHAELIDAMALRVCSLGATPWSNDLVDLGANTGGVDYLFEMKSTNRINFHPQIRRGLSQLYEYAYVHQLPGATLCLVTETQPSQAKSWLVDYLVDARSVHVCWKSSANQQRFECVAKSSPAIGQFM